MSHDPIAVGDIRNLISHLKDRGIGVLITDHNVRDCLGIVDRAYILHDGKVLMEGDPKAIVNHEDVRRVYLGEGFSLVEASAERRNVAGENRGAGGVKAQTHARCSCWSARV